MSDADPCDLVEAIDEGEELENPTPPDFADLTILDATTASAVIGVYDAISPANQFRMGAMPVMQMISIAWKVLQKAEDRKN